MPKLALAVILLSSLLCSPLHAAVTNLCSNPNVSIPDWNTSGVRDVISVVAPGMVVTDLEVDVDINHSNVSNLAISLENTERAVGLYSDSICAGTDILATFTDLATVRASDMCDVTPPVVNGPVLPWSPLLTFDGTSWDGDWTLTVIDYDLLDTGRLVNWCITATTVANTPPQSLFSVTCTNLNCQFVDQSTDSDGTVTAWLWEFGDVSSSSEQSPLHTYAADGVYTVTLTVADNYRTIDSSSQQVNAHPFRPTASFTSTCSNLTCDFQDTSTDSNGSIVSWLWDFGDGTVSNQQNPQRTYALDGIYTVSLTVTDNDGLEGVTSALVDADPNIPPVANPQAVQVLEDTAIQITMSGSDADGDPLTFEISDPPQNGDIGQEPGDGPDQQTYRPRTDYSGPDLFSFIAFDGVDTSAPATVDITVIEVNDPPRFIAGPGALWPAGETGSKSHPAWATGIAPGPLDTEVGQSVSFNVSLDDPDGIIAPLTVVELQNDGTLNYTLSGKSGRAEISITLSDDGGVDNNGIDTSDPQVAVIEVIHGTPALPASSYAWSMQLPALYNPAETCCFDYTGDTVPDDAFGGLASLLASFGVDANQTMAQSIEAGSITELLFWDGLPLLGTTGPFQLEFSNGLWFGPATFPQRVTGMEDFLLDSNGLDGFPANVQDCFVDAVGQFSCTGSALTLPLVTNGTTANLAATTLRDVKIEGSYSDSRIDCSGNCSIDETSVDQPPIRGGFKIGGYVHMDDYFTALNDTYQSCVCFGNGNVQLFDFGEGPSDYQFSCTADGQQAAGCTACQDILLPTICSLGGTLIVNSADIDSNANGINDSLSIGMRMAVSGANIVGCIGTQCAPRPEEIFIDGFEDISTPPP